MIEIRIFFFSKIRDHRLSVGWGFYRAPPQTLDFTENGKSYLNQNLTVGTSWGLVYE